MKAFQSMQRIALVLNVYYVNMEVISQCVENGALTKSGLARACLLSVKSCDRVASFHRPPPRVCVSLSTSTRVDGLFFLYLVLFLPLLQLSSVHIVNCILINAGSSAIQRLGHVLTYRWPEREPFRRGFWRQ